MKTIERYVFGAFMSSFILAFLVLSFVLTIGLLVQIVSYVLDGVSLSLVGEFAAVSFPETMQWTIPLALLVSSVLVFSRLSADSEIAAMRSCGVNLVMVMKWPVIFALGCSVLGAWINNEIVPRGHEVRRSLKTKVSVDTGLEMLEPGLWIEDFPKVKLYFGGKEGNWLYDLIVMDYSDSKVDRMIRASKAGITSEGRDIHLDLYNVTVDPLDAEHPQMMTMARCQHTIKDALDDTKYVKKGKDLRFFELVAKIREMKNFNEIERQIEQEEDKASAKEVSKRESKKAFSKSLLSEPEDKDEEEQLAGGKKYDKNQARKNHYRQRSKLKTELSKRFVFAMASLCFVLVGIPLGIRSQRKESSIGMAISLGVAIGYYLLVMLMMSLQKNYKIHPEYLMWLPVAISLALAARFIAKNR